MKVKLPQSCLTLRDPMDCSLPGTSIHGIFQARILERVAIAFSTFKDKNKPNNTRLKVQKQKILRRGGKNTQNCTKKIFMTEIITMV